MTYKKFEKLLQGELNTLNAGELEIFLQDIVNYLSTQHIELGNHYFSCQKIKETFINEKIGLVRTELAFFAENDTPEPLAIITVDSTMRRLTSETFKFSNCRNYSIRKYTDDDTMSLLIAFSFAMKMDCEDRNINSLIGVGAVMRSSKGKVINAFNSN